MPKADPTKYARKPYLEAWHYERSMAFVAAITGETGPKGNGDDYRGRLMSLAVAYDWLYPCALFRAVAPKGARITVVCSRGR